MSCKQHTVFCHFWCYVSKQKAGGMLYGKKNNHYLHIIVNLFFIFFSVTFYVLGINKHWVIPLYNSAERMYLYCKRISRVAIKDLSRTSVIQLNPVDLVIFDFLVICTAPSRYRNQWWIVNCDHKNKLPYNLNKFAKSFFQEVHLNMASAYKLMASILLRAQCDVNPISFFNCLAHLARWNCLLGWDMDYLQ